VNPNFIWQGLGLALGKVTLCLDFSTFKEKFLTHPHLLHKAVDN